MTELLSTFEDYVRRRCARGNPSEHTVRGYRTQARLWLEWCREHGVEPRKATEEDVVSYRAELVARYKAATVQLKLQCVRHLYDALGREPNPAEGVQAPPDPTPPQEEIEFLTVEEARAVLAVVDAVDDPQRRARDRAILTTLLTLGLRASELRALRLDDLDLGRGRLVVRAGKGRKRRVLWLTDGLERALRGWLALRPATESDRLFVGLTGRGGLSDSGLRKIVNGYLRKAGCKREGQASHIFRHTAITLAIAGGARREHVQRMAGHADPRTTDAYVHLVAAREENPARVVEGVLGSRE
jgi:site-specific recombinase XerD